MSTPVPTTLSPGWRSSASLLPAVAASFAGHLVLAVGAFFWSLVMGWLFPAAPLVDPNQAIEVSFVVLKKSSGSMPERATRAPRLSGAPDAALAEPPPARESDLAFETDRPDEKTKGDPMADLRRAEMMAALERERLMADLTAATGDRDQDASDPNSSADFSLNAGGQGDPADPEYARYLLQLQQLFMQHFRPLPNLAEANPGIRAVVFVEVEPETGRVVGWQFKKASGVAAYDRAAELAVQAVPTIPKPPPKYAHLAKSGYVIQFDPPRR